MAKPNRKPAQFRQNDLNPFRALTLFEKLPSGHRTFSVRDQGSAPHLKESEFAVIDTTDREVQHGELFVIQYRGLERRRCIVQARADRLNITGPGAEESLCWWVSQLRGFRRTDRKVMSFPVYEGLSDGPYRTENLQAQLLGRVVGYARTSLGGLLQQCAGYEREAEGNAAFDASEYLDVLIDTGHKPCVMLDAQGEPGLYCE